MDLDTKQLAILVQSVFKNPKGEALLDSWSKLYQHRVNAGETNQTFFNIGRSEFIQDIKDYLSLTQEDLDNQESPDQHPFD